MNTAPNPDDADDVGGAASGRRLWHAGWALAVATGAASLLAGFGAVSGNTLFALCLGALPGAAGLLLRPGGGRQSLVFAWSVAAVLAACLTGGLSGPLGVWCVTPLLGGAMIGLLPLGAMLSIVAAAVSLLVQLAHFASPAPSDGLGVGLAVIGLATAGGAAAAVLKAAIANRGETQAPGEAPTAEAPPAAEAQVQAPVAETAASGASRVQIARLRTQLRAARSAQARTALALSAAKAELGRGAAGLEAERDARLRADANAASKSRFLANMSHELRTPLNAIMGFSDIMRARMFGDLSPKYAEYAELIHESGRHLTELINDVLDMSKIEAERYVLSRELFDVRDPVNAALRLVRLQAEEAGIQLKGVLPAEPLRVDADRRALKQIVLNLVSNALKFTPRAGSVTVTVQAAEGVLELVVADTGVGIAKQDLERLGRPFEQAGDADRRVQGTGLGLSLVKALAALHGGEMTIESEPGEGVAVTVRLPVLSPADEPAAPPSPQGPPPRTGEVIPLNLSRQS